jgi:hypothetical protein
MLNFKDFEKIAQDDNTVTMKHKKGHQMKSVAQSASTN